MSSSAKPVPARPGLRNGLSRKPLADQPRPSSFHRCGHARLQRQTKGIERRCTHCARGSVFPALKSPSQLVKRLWERICGSKAVLIALGSRVTEIFFKRVKRINRFCDTRLDQDEWNVVAKKRS